ncbi:hypothetical protein CJP74_04025 [Psittacicella melopsittaci]|uniref:Ribonuclease n=1 Tax=Psittacicella melopsittaci TaxID=2028576 RepID=A0A3A1Y5V8_9GAMM|nr:ribonuclease HII [Psittacicella melopsittaci]RIY32660.1 hypothetical protein CJP74_04025 [Psittacicella melopsittaci]
MTISTLEHEDLTKFTQEQQGYILIGADEAGRGCMFGPVVTAAALIGFVDYATLNQLQALPLAQRWQQMQQQQRQVEQGEHINPYYQSLGLQLDIARTKDLLTYAAKSVDSKKISEKKRHSLYQEFISQGQEGKILFAIEEGSVAEIAQKNILHASLAAMSRAVLQVVAQLEERCQQYGIDFAKIRSQIVVLIDGNQKLPDLGDLTQQAVVKGDALVREISVASILAKNYRDLLMQEMSQLPQYANYKVDKHKGYVTAEHVELLFKYGPSDQHRQDYRQVRLASQKAKA